MSPTKRYQVVAVSRQGKQHVIRTNLTDSEAELLQGVLRMEEHALHQFRDNLFRFFQDVETTIYLADLHATIDRLVPVGCWIKFRRYQDDVQRITYLIAEV